MSCFYGDVLVFRSSLLHAAAAAAAATADLLLLFLWSTAAAAFLSCCCIASQPRLESCMRAEGRTTTGRVTYAGRDPSASTATGYGEVHAQEQAKLINEALDVSYKMPYDTL
jgi:hypothetical protein